MFAPCRVGSGDRGSGTQTFPGETPEDAARQVSAPSADGPELCRRGEKGDSRLGHRSGLSIVPVELWRLPAVYGGGIAWRYLCGSVRSILCLLKIEVRATGAPVR